MRPQKMAKREGQVSKKENNFGANQYTMEKSKISFKENRKSIRK